MIIVNADKIKFLEDFFVDLFHCNQHFKNSREGMTEDRKALLKVLEEWDCVRGQKYSANRKSLG
jgi:hypothetical protein